MIKHYKSQFNVYLNSPIKYTIAGKNIWKLNFNKPVESKTQFTKYSINVNCGKQQIYRFGPGLNFNVKYLLLLKKKKQEFNVTMKKQEFNVTM